MATHSSFIAWKISWTEEAGRLYSPWDCKESDTTEVTEQACTHTYVLDGICVYILAYYYILNITCNSIKNTIIMYQRYLSKNSVRNLNDNRLY